MTGLGCSLNQLDIFENSRQPEIDVVGLGVMGLGNSTQAPVPHPASVKMVGFKAWGFRGCGGFRALGSGV